MQKIRRRHTELIRQTWHVQLRHRRQIQVPCLFQISSVGNVRVYSEQLQQMRASCGSDEDGVSVLLDNCV